MLTGPLNRRPIARLLRFRSSSQHTITASPSMRSVTVAKSPEGPQERQMRVSRLSSNPMGCAPPTRSSRGQGRKRANLAAVADGGRHFSGEIHRRLHVASVLEFADTSLSEFDVRASSTRPDLVGSKRDFFYRVEANHLYGTTFPQTTIPASPTVAVRVESDSVRIECKH